jgi:predicted ATPase
VKVVISGTACSGKTTTIKSFEAKGYKVVQESPTAYIEEQQKLNLEMSDILSDLVKFEKEVIKRQLHAEKTTDLYSNEIIFLDRSLVDVVAFCRMLSIPDIENEASEHIQNAQYTLVFILEKLPFEKIGTRWEVGDEQADIQDTYLR